MTSKEKAKELVEKFGGYKTKTGFIIVNIERAKQCALICVGEILDQFPKKGNQYDGTSYLMFKGNIEYWEEVKQEIQKL